MEIEDSKGCLNEGKRHTGWRFLMTIIHSIGNPSQKVNHTQSPFPSTCTLFYTWYHSDVSSR